MPRKQLTIYILVLALMSLVMLTEAQISVLSPNQVTGIYPGYNTNTMIPACVQMGTGLCSQCAFRYYYFNGNCVPVSDLCNTWDNYTGGCTTCYMGYSLSGTVCVLGTADYYSPASVIPNCNQYGGAGLCSQCAYRYYNLNGYCQPVNNLCNTWDTFGNCLTCYAGYSIVSGSCVIGAPNYYNSYPSVPNCGQFGIAGGCVTCLNGYYLANGVCQKINSLCNTWSPHSGVCTSCVSKYQLVGKNCVLGITGGPGNYNVMNCARMGPNGSCQQCSNRYYLFNGFCNSVSPLCNAWQPNSGACTSCFNGYSIYGSGCVLSTQMNNRGGPGGHDNNHPHL
jgi:hypothetical protein